MGQGSIFDLFDAGAAADASPFNAPTHPPIPIDEFDRNELLAMEKESIGIFISEHPLKRVREALTGQGRLLDRRGHRPARRRVGQGRRHDHRVQEDPDAVGLDDDVRDARRPRRLGRDRGLREGARRRRGRDRRRRDRARSAAGSITRRPARSASSSPDVDKFDPSDAEIEKAKAQVGEGRRGRARARSSAAWTPPSCPPTVIDDLRELFERYPGETEFVLEMHTRTGLRRLKFGDALQGQGARRGLQGRARRPAAAVAVAAAAAHGAAWPSVARGQPLREPARAQVVRPRHVDRVDLLAGCGPGPRRSPAGPRSAAPRGRRSCPRRRSRRRRG